MSGAARPIGWMPWPGDKYRRPTGRRHPCAPLTSAPLSSVPIVGPLDHLSRCPSVWPGDNLALGAPAFRKPPAPASVCLNSWRILVASRSGELAPRRPKWSPACVLVGPGGASRRRGQSAGRQPDLGTGGPARCFHPAPAKGLLGLGEQLFDFIMMSAAHKQTPPPAPAPFQSRIAQLILIINCDLGRRNSTRAPQAAGRQSRSSIAYWPQGRALNSFMFLNGYTTQFVTLNKFTTYISSTNRTRRDKWPRRLVQAARRRPPPEPLFSTFVQFAAGSATSGAHLTDWAASGANDKANRWPPSARF